jgi:hypothetical protein
MLEWLENHLIVLGLLAVFAGLALGAVVTRAQRKAGSDSRRRSAASSGTSGSRTTGAGSVTPTY